jgi:hypothetical protein
MVVFMPSLLLFACVYLSTGLWRTLQRHSRLDGPCYGIRWSSSSHLPLVTCSVYQVASTEVRSKADTRSMPPP